MLELPVMPVVVPVGEAYRDGAAASRCATNTPRGRTTITDVCVKEADSKLVKEANSNAAKTTISFVSPVHPPKDKQPQKTYWAQTSTPHYK